MFTIDGTHTVYVLPDDEDAVLAAAEGLIRQHVETWVVADADTFNRLADAIAGTSEAARFHVFIDESDGYKQEPNPDPVPAQVDLVDTLDWRLVDSTPHLSGVATGFGDVLIFDNDSSLAIQVKSADVFGVFVRGFEALRAAVAASDPTPAVEEAPAPVGPPVEPDAGAPVQTPPESEQPPLSPAGV